MMPVEMARSAFGGGVVSRSLGLRPPEFRAIGLGTCLVNLPGARLAELVEIDGFDHPTGSTPLAPFFHGG